MSETTDPRERLIVLGNQILDLVYKLHLDNDRRRALEAAKHDRDRFRELLGENGEGVKFLFEQLSMTTERDVLISEYVAIRQTIDAMAPKGSGS